MPKYAWASDAHLNFLHGDNAKLLAFAESLVAQDPTGIFLTGDTSTSPELVYHLSVIEKVAQRPIYFACGNHDFYAGSIEATHKSMVELSSMSSFLHYVPAAHYHVLTTNTALVGGDGWGDCGWGDWKRSRMVLNDWSHIAEFAHINSDPLEVMLLAKKLAHEGATQIHDGIKRAVKYHKNIIVLTHVPPFREVCLHEGRASSEDALPWYVNKMLGDVLLDASKAFPLVNFTVLCGHTHSQAQLQVTSNLRVFVAGAEYYEPALASMIDVL